jgi:hypothetical protein
VQRSSVSATRERLAGASGAQQQRRWPTLNSTAGAHCRVVRPAKSSRHWCGPIAGWLPPSTTVRLVPPLSGPDIGETSSSSEAGSAGAISMPPRARSVEDVALWEFSTHASRSGASTWAMGSMAVDIKPFTERRKLARQINEISQQQRAIATYATNEPRNHSTQPNHCSAGAGSTGQSKQRAGSRVTYGRLAHSSVTSLTIPVATLARGTVHHI